MPGFKVLGCNGYGPVAERLFDRVRVTSGTTNEVLAIAGHHVSDPQSPGSDLRRFCLSYDDTVTRMPFDPLELPIHYARHRTDFAVATDKEYERLAEHFLARPPAPHLLECKRGGGDFTRYDTITREYIVRSGGGAIRTYFKPVPCSSIPAGLPRVRCHGYVDNIEYFNKKCLEW